MSPSRKGHNQPSFSVLVDWGRNHRALGDYFELLEGPFTMVEAENVCHECRRLGAELASGHTTSAARKLFLTDPRGAPARHDCRDAEALRSVPSSTSQTRPTTEGGICMARVIELIVTKEGQTTVQTKGYSGETCLEASKWLEKALGITTDDRTTGEFFQQLNTERHIQQE
jgi:hypothetical protein